MGNELELWDSQVSDLAYYMANPKCFNLSDPGTGKTPSVCVYAYYKWSYDQEKTVWIMPKSLLQKNKNELHAFTPFKDDEVIIVDGTPKQRTKQMSGPAGKVFLMGFDAFRRNWEALLVLQPTINLALVDEWHMGYKSNTSKRTQGLYVAMRRIKSLVGMTGTLIDGRLDSVYPAIHIVQPLYYPNYNAFLNFHADMIDDYGTVLQWKNTKKVSKILKEISVKHTFEEIHGPESKITNVEKVPMGKEARKAYNEFHNEAMLELEDRFLDGSLPGVAVIRARQIMAHPETFGITKEKSGKDDRLEIHLTDAQTAGEAVIIYSVHVPEMERIRDLCLEMGLATSFINGNITGAKRLKAANDFEEQRSQVMVGSPETAAVGFNWGHAAHVIFATMDYKDTSFFQAYRRAMRGKRKTPLRITILQYEDSVDQRVFSIVKEKAKLANEVDPTRQQLVV